MPHPQVTQRPHNTPRPTLSQLHRVLILALIFLSVLSAGDLLLAQAPQPSPATASPRARVSTAAQAVAQAYNPQTGLFTGTGWWNSANGITALADAARALHTSDFDPIFANTFTAAQKTFPGFRNQFYDDEGWWALAWLDVYRLHPNPRYLGMASAIFEDMTTGWSPACGGGLWWKKDSRYKNAIPNELFLAVAVQLAQATQGDARATYLAWAQKEKTWFLSSGMINSAGLVNDGLTASCKNNGQTTWTYNQGVLVLGLTQLSQLTGDRTALATATRIANAAADHLTDSAGVLHDANEPHCGPDGIQFKGILARDLVPLQRVAPSPAVQHMLDASASSAWTRAQTDLPSSTQPLTPSPTNSHSATPSPSPTLAFACSWSGPATNDGTGALISALDLFTADLLVASISATP